MPIAVELVKKFPSIYGPQKFITLLSASVTTPFDDPHDLVLSSKCKVKVVPVLNESPCH